jgi:hypothetical protein
MLRKLGVLAAALVGMGIFGWAKPPAQPATRTTLDEFSALGWARARFGERPNAGKTGYSVPGAMGGSVVIFPAGRSDTRYYWTAELSRLTCETKRNGHIKLEWSIAFQKADPPVSSKKAGTLWRLVSTHLRPEAKVPKAALAALRAHQAFAVYQPADSVNVSPTAWFVKVDGKEVGYEGFDNGGGNALPRTRNPYPITKAERKAILAARAKKPASARTR